MKKITAIRLFTFITVALIGKLSAQNHSHQHNGHDHSNIQLPDDWVSEEDIKALTDFDEAAVIKELKEKGILESEFEGIIRRKKIDYILDKRGVSRKPIYVNPVVNPYASACDNAGFDSTNFNNWTGQTGSVNTTGVATWSGGIISSGLNAAVNNPSARQTIVNTPAGLAGIGYDPIARNITTGNYEITLVAPGGKGVSARLGNSNIGNETENLSFPIAVTASNTSFTYQYAVVLESPSGHSAVQQPKFLIKVFDQNGVQISGPCGQYSVEGLAAATDTTFKPYWTGSGQNPTGYYKKWTTVGIDLTPYINTTVTIVFQTIDCTLGGHYGYAYIDASCSKLQAAVDFCPNDTALILTAPGGYNTYQWYDQNSVAIPGATADTLLIVNPVLGQQYSVAMLSASGCGSTLSVILQYSDLLLNGISTNVKCFGDNDGFALVTPTGASGPYTYAWVDSASGQMVNNKDSLNDAVAGTYYVTVWSKGGCSKTDTITITQPLDAADTLGVPFSFCPGDDQIVLYAPPVVGSTGYIWYAGNSSGPVVGNDDSLVINNPVAGYQYTVEVIMPTPLCHLFVTTTLNYQPPPAMPDYIVKTNVFTPNNDGHNDYFDLNKFDYVKDFSVEIYNRWGKRVYESTDVKIHWDGKINGKAADDGVYYWIAKYTESCHENPPVITNTGFVHVIR